MKRRFIIGQVDKRLLRTGATTVAVFRPSAARGRTWTVALQQSNRKSRSLLRVIGATTAIAIH
jgi:hypothetical protein